MYKGKADRPGAAAANSQGLTQGLGHGRHEDDAWFDVKRVWAQSDRPRFGNGDDQGPHLCELGPRDTED